MDGRFTSVISAVTASWPSRMRSACSALAACRIDRLLLSSNAISSAATDSSASSTSSTMRFLYSMLGYEPVADAVHGYEMPRRLGVGLQFLPEPHDVSVNCARIGEGLVAPHRIE